MNAHTEIAVNEPAAPVFPIVYAMRVDAPNGAGEYAHDDLILCNTLEEPQAGDIACVHLRSGSAVLLVLTLSLPPHVWGLEPYREHPDSTALALIVGRVLGTERDIAIRARSCWAVHKCDGKADPADCATDAEVA